jgi:probable H4MPT-linked C1 transfer pathway protein
MICGWDIGGVNTKVACVVDGAIHRVCVRPYELQRAPEALVPLLRHLADEVRRDVTPSADIAAHAVTMTAELSQMFRTKREGVAFVLDAVESAFPGAAIHVYTVDGAFVSCADARRDPLRVAAANWSATAHLVAHHYREALLVDIGTTTTDVIPIVDGVVAAAGRTDPDRLASGELVYTGALRTPVEAIVRSVPYAGSMASVSAEAFALIGDVHLWRGDLSAADYTVPTPDGRPATRECAGERLARVICADRETLDQVGVSAIADAVARAQVDSIAHAMRRVTARHPSLRTCVVTGLGAFIGDRAARIAGIDVVHLEEELGNDAGRCAPAAAVAVLLNADLASAPEPSLRPGALKRTQRAGRRDAHADPLTVIKIGGGLLAQPEHVDATHDAIACPIQDVPMVVIPGGGPFADAVRDADATFGLDDDAAHWMAVLAMDQYAVMLASRITGAALVRNADDIAAALDAGTLPVLAPFQWLRAADPLPHSWDVTSDSIAAWIAREVGAWRLVLVKPAGAAGDATVDASFENVLGSGVDVRIVHAGDSDGIQLALRGLSSAESIRFSATPR